MKKVLFALVALIMFAGCSKDDAAPENNQNYETLIQGHWEILKETVIIYDADNKVIHSEPVDDAVGIKWLLENGKVTAYTGPDDDDQATGTYTLNTKVDPPTMRIVENGGNDEDLTLVNITKLNQTDMVLEANEDISDAPEGDLEDADHATVRFELQRFDS